MALSYMQAEMSLEDLQAELAACGILRLCPEERLRDCVAGGPLTPAAPQQAPPLWDVKQLLTGDLVLPLACAELHARCDFNPAQVEAPCEPLRHVLRWIFFKCGLDHCHLFNRQESSWSF